MKTEITKHAGKGSQQELLPSKHALFRLSGGDPARRTANDYAKAGPDVVRNGPNIVERSRGTHAS